MALIKDKTLPLCKRSIPHNNGSQTEVRVALTKQS